MALEKTLRGVNKVGKTFLTSLLAAATLSLAGCNKNTVNVPDDIIIDTKHIGSIEGGVYTPYAENSHVVWKGVKGAEVEILKTNFRTTTLIGGKYSIDSLPDAAYEVKASLGAHNPDTVSVVVEKQDKTTADSLKLTPVRRDEWILYGTILNADGNPARNQEIDIFQSNLSLFDNRCDHLKDYPGSRVATFRTNPQGEYAIQDLMNMLYTVYFQTKAGKRLNFNNGTTCIENGNSGLNQPINERNLYIP
ncbi:hypothetical protein HY212_02365 [Candidatus Pacearchaeota archaeon]|nr:hypothetical protein [Candidatus Pacearchaeota archaeon]